MRAPILALASRNSITRIVNVLLMDVFSILNLNSLIGRNPMDFLVVIIEICFFRLHETFRFVKIILGAHASLSLRSGLTM